MECGGYHLTSFAGVDLCPESLLIHRLAFVSCQKNPIAIHF